MTSKVETLTPFRAEGSNVDTGGLQTQRLRFTKLPVAPDVNKKEVKDYSKSI